MSYQVLARKWRPRNFSEMVGQEHVLKALINALDRDQLHHAYLFTGTRGVGKTTVARIFAKSLNCETHGVTATPCGECNTCREIDEGRFVDLIEVDAASRTKVDETRELLDNVQYLPTKGRYKVYLIDEVHMFSNHSFNALLKTLEEPPPHVKFLLATTDPQKLPVTIRSRCLQFNLKQIPQRMIEEYLSELLNRESVESESDALAPIARAAEGSMRDALSLLDQAIAFGGGALRSDEVAAMLGTIEQRQLLEIVRALSEQNSAALLQQVDLLAEKAADFAAVLVELIAQLHQMALIQMVPEVAEDRGVDAEWVALSEALSPEDVQLFYQIALTGRKDLPLAATPRGGLEMVLLRMLAFQPVSRAGGAASTTAAPPTTPQRVPSSGAAGARAALAAQPSEPSAIENPSPAPSTPTQSKSQPAATVTLQPEAWEQTVASLSLGGLARQLVRNSLLQSQQGNRITLEIADKNSSLLNARVEQQIREALEQHLGGAVQLSITVTERKALDTPAARAEQRADQARAEAVDIIQQDETFQSLVNTFDGAVVEGSIQPVEQPK